MTYHRTWFSYVLWFIYTVLCIILIGVVDKVWIRLLTTVGIAIPRLIYGNFVILMVALYWMVRGIATYVRQRWTWKERSAKISACIAFVLILAFAVIIRIVCLNYYVSYTETYGTGFIDIEQMNLGYYDMAVFAEQGSVPPMDYGISSLYVMLLSVVLSFLGHKVVSAVLLQVFLQICGMVLAYTVARKVAGRLPASISMLYLAGSLTCLGMLFRLGPEWLYFILYMIGMLTAVIFVKNYCADNIPRFWAVVCAVDVGALIGALTYLDLIGASLLIVILIAATGQKTGPKAARCHYYSKGMDAAVIVCSCISCVAVWVGIMSMVSYLKGTDVIKDILSRVQICYANSSPYASAPFSGAEYYPDIYWIGALIIFASFLIFEFFRSGKEQNYMLWILLCLLAAPTPMAMYGEHGFRGLPLYVWSVLAGLGLQNCIYGGRVKVMQAVIEEINAAADRAKQSVSMEQTIETKESDIMENQPSKPRYIENPLPLPRKHIAKEMDYQYMVEEKDMRYDVEVPEDDDYDVQ